jgi:preprotein translocase subunit YajC
MKEFSMPQNLADILGEVFNSFGLIGEAHAQTTGSAGGFDFMGLAPLVVIFVAFHFFLIRPQQKKAQQQREMLSAVSKGDRIVTAGGIIGKVHSIENDMEVVLEVEGGMHIRMLKSAIVEQIPSGSSTKGNVSAVRGEDGSSAKTKPRRLTNPKKSPKGKTTTK